MVVYVLNIDNKPLMPTTRFGKVRRLLRNKKAKVVKRTPFTIKLLYRTDNNVQDITLGVYRLLLKTKKYFQQSMNCVMI